MNSISAFGRTRQTSSLSVPTHSGASAWAIATRSPGLVLGRLREAPLELGERLRPAADARDCDDLAVLRRRGSGRTFSSEPASAAARPMRPPRWRYSSVSTVKTTPHLAVEALDQRRDLDVGRPAREPPLDRVREHRDRERGGLRVDDADPVVAELRGGELGALERPGELRGDVERVDPLVPGEALVGAEEVLRRRLGGRGKDR